MSDSPSGSQLNQPNGQMTVDPAALTGNGAGSSSNGNGNIYFDCNVCGRQVRVSILQTSIHVWVC